MGWNGSRPGEKPEAIGKKAPSKVRGLIALGVVLVVGMGTCLVFLHLSSPRAVESAQKSMHAKGEFAQDGKRPTARKLPAEETGIASVKNSAIGTTTPAAKAPQNNIPVEGETQVATNALPVRPKPTFKNATDELIALATTTEDGALAPPLPELSKGDTEKFLEAYRKPIPIDEKDSDEVKSLKQHVNAVREQIAGLIAQDPNRSLSDILNTHRDTVNANAELYAEAKKQFDALAESDDPEMAEQYRTKANELLSASGAKTIEKEEEESDNE